MACGLWNLLCTHKVCNLIVGVLWLVLTVWLLMMLKVSGCNNNNNCVTMALVHEEEDDHNHEDKRSNKMWRANTLWNLKNTPHW